MTRTAEIALRRASQVLGVLLCLGGVATCAKTPPDGATPAVPAFDPTVPPGYPPRIPVGIDAYRYWERWPYLRLGARTYMRGTYDRTGGNDLSDASHFLREVAPGNDVALDVAGAGYLYFTRANHWHGSPWHFQVDGRDETVSESSTASPDTPVDPSVILPAAAFPSPLALTSATTLGADVSWVPVGFETSVALAYGRSHYGTGYFTYALYDPGADFSRNLESWTTSVAPPPDVTALLARAGDDIAPTGEGVLTAEGSVDLPADGAVTLLDREGPSVLRALRLTVPAAEASAMKDAHLRITWDDRALPSVDAPIPLFFGAGTLFHRAKSEYLVRSLPSVIRFAGGTIELSTYFPMPFQRKAHIELVGGGVAAPGIAWSVRSLPYAGAPSAAGYFHATFHDHGAPTPGADLVLLDSTVDEGGGDACGHFIGTSFSFSDRGVLTTLEGDPRFFFDDSQTPQAQGTGTEEWGAGGDYWNGGQLSTLAFAGHPTGAPDGAPLIDAEDGVESAYRFLLGDLFPFGKNARIQLEHGGLDDSTEHYRTVAYWYALPSACLVQTDALHVSDLADEAAHRYVSPDASDIDTVESRYEWGVDHLLGDPDGAEVYPATVDTGRHMTGTTELSIALRPDNFGVLLRRKLDDSFVDQRAEVFVADDSPDAAFLHAGTWFLAGSNTYAVVDAASETGVGTPTVETSNRRWRDDELLLPRALTHGRDHVRIRIVNVPSATPVAPGVPSGPSAWSEYRYTAYSYVVPAAP